MLISSALSLGINAGVKIITDGSESYHDALHFTEFSIDSDHQLTSVFIGTGSTQW